MSKDTYAAKAAIHQAQLQGHKIHKRPATSGETGINLDIHQTFMKYTGITLGEKGDGHEEFKFNSLIWVAGGKGQAKFGVMTGAYEKKEHKRGSPLVWCWSAPDLREFYRAVSSEWCLLYQRSADQAAPAGRDSWLFAGINQDERDILLALVGSYGAPVITTQINQQSPLGAGRCLSTVAAGDISTTLKDAKRARNISLFEGSTLMGQGEMYTFLDVVFDPNSGNCCDTLSIPSAALKHVKSYLGLLQSSKSRTTRLKHVFVFDDSGPGTLTVSLAAKTKVVIFSGMPFFSEESFADIQPLVLNGGGGGGLALGGGEDDDEEEADKKKTTPLPLLLHTAAMAKTAKKVPPNVELPVSCVPHSEVLQRLMTVQDDNTTKKKPLTQKERLVHLQPSKSIPLEIVAVMADFLQDVAGKPAVVSLVAAAKAEGARPAAPWCPEFEAFAWEHLDVANQGPRWLQLADLMELAVYLDITALKVFVRGSMITEIQLRNLGKANASLLDAMLPLRRISAAKALKRNRDTDEDE